MSEFREPHTVARLIGSPPGYVGYGDGGQLTEPVRRRPYSVVLLDEIEKAHPEVWNVLLAADGRRAAHRRRGPDGRLHQHGGRDDVEPRAPGEARRGIGFTAGASRRPPAERMREAAKAAFLPEFLNRIDEIVTFEALTPEQVERIAALVVGAIAERLRAERGIELDVAPELVARLARDGFDEQFGARPLKRHVRRTLEKALTRAILDGRLADGARRPRDARRGRRGGARAARARSAPRAA